MSVPESTQAIIVESPGRAVIKTVPVPKLRPGYLLVRPLAIALNPSDWKHIDGHMGDVAGARVGNDYCGIVLAVGPDVTPSFHPGDRVAGFVHGANALQHEDGAFAGVIAVKASCQIRVPDNLTNEEAATLGVGISTVGQGLYQGLKLPLPVLADAPAAPATKADNVKAPVILVYGGSTATGQLGIQFAKLSGYRVLTTASQRNFAYLKELGADDIFDYNNPTCAADIRAATDGKLDLVWDCVTTPQSTRLCAAAMGEQGGRYGALNFISDEDLRPDMATTLTLAYTSVGEEVQKAGFSWPPSREDQEFASTFWDLSKKLLTAGKIKVPRPIVNRGGKGFEGALVGLEDMRAGKVSGGKLVYTL